MFKRFNYLPIMHCRHCVGTVNSKTFRYRPSSIQKFCIFLLPKTLKSRSNSRYYSSAKIEDDPDEFEDLNFKDMPVIRRPQEIRKDFQKKPPKPPFVKNLFYEVFDTDILTYPAIFSKERYELLHKTLAPIENLFKEKVDSNRIDEEEQITSDIIESLKQLGLFGMEIPSEYGGLELNATEVARITEVLSLDSSIALTIDAHQSLAAKSILINGTEQQKIKYLPQLSTGERIAAFCLTESSGGSDALSINCEAVPTSDDKGFMLNGRKSWVTNGGLADIYIVFAKIKYPNFQNKDMLSAFIVERDFGGVTSVEAEKRLGMRGANITEVHFRDTFVPKENILGKNDEGLNVALTNLSSGRVSLGAGCASVLRQVIELAVHHVTTRKQFGNTLSLYGILQDKLSLMALDAYAMEAMTYLTTGMIDSFENQDCTVEEAIVKVFSTEKLFLHASECIKLMGAAGLVKGTPFDRILRDSCALQFHRGTNEVMRLLISLSSLKHAGVAMNERVKKLRNPMMYPEEVLKPFLRNFMTVKRHVDRLTMDLIGYLHPSCLHGADSLERSVKRLAAATRIIFVNEGKEVVHPDNQFHLRRLADMAIDIYAMTAVLARASRSYCLGFYNSDQEMMLMNLFCKMAYERVDMNYKKITFVMINENDIMKESIAKNLYFKKGFAAEHPLTKLHW